MDTSSHNRVEGH